ncbi:hypothetical protein FACS1894186_5530 [Alphaproteobacteria bacterium]|nr:hypothetical protein FACS1894186_5530 [Alphaproteobacteria bacterium]
MREFHESNITSEFIFKLYRSGALSGTDIPSSWANRGRLGRCPPGVEIAPLVPFQYGGEATVDNLGMFPCGEVHQYYKQYIWPHVDAIKPGKTRNIPTPRQWMFTREQLSA